MDVARNKAWAIEVCGQLGDRSSATAVVSGRDIDQAEPRAASIRVYAWYFREIPGSVPYHDCVVQQELTLLHIPHSVASSGQFAAFRTERP
jgi:hypothetical protein